MGGQTDYERVVTELDRKISSMLNDQVMEETRPDYGGYFSENLGFASPSHIGNSQFLRLIGLGYLTQGSSYYQDEDIFERIRLASEFQQRCQRPSGRIDIPFANFDSPPDTAFSVSQVAPVAWLAGESEAAKADLVADCLRPYLVSAAKGIAGAGFHTPNHRWVVVDALTQVNALYTDHSFEAEIERYLSEGIDVNEDGLYSERSNAIYNAVVNRHLIRAAEILERPELLEPVRKNLHLMSDLLRDDWTILTSISHRQDGGQRTIPTRSADSFYYMGRHDDDDRLKTVAYELLKRDEWPSTLLEHFHRYPDWAEKRLTPGERETAFTRELEDSGIWQVRDGKLTATMAIETSDAPFELTYGDVAMTGIGVYANYFGASWFEGEQISFRESGAELRLSTDYGKEQLPAFWKPLGHPVPFEDLPYGRLEERELESRPEFEIVIDVERDGTEFDVQIRTEGGMPGVPFVVECRFASPDHVEIQGSMFSPSTENGPVCHGSESLTVLTGTDAITIENGFLSHRLTETPSTDDEGELLRVVMTDWSPVEKTITFRCHEQSFADDERTEKGPANAFRNPES